jgi:hypothetical protein
VGSLCGWRISLSGVSREPVVAASRISSSPPSDVVDKVASKLTTERIVDGALDRALCCPDAFAVLGTGLTILRRSISSEANRPRLPVRCLFVDHERICHHATHLRRGLSDCGFTELRPYHGAAMKGTTALVSCISTRLLVSAPAVVPRPVHKDCASGVLLTCRHKSTTPSIAPSTSRDIL